MCLKIKIARLVYSGVDEPPLLRYEYIRQKLSNTLDRRPLHAPIDPGITGIIK